MQQTEILAELCAAAEAMLDAVNVLYDADNPAEALAIGRVPLSESAAREQHTAAFARLQRAIYYGRKAARIGEPSQQD